ncbi:MAG: carboxypeptidase regulatory-like domain-containing protein, partial [Kofleriaceae bacterium]|nr:carboxypeptidase regulatory-like domain-containing protein [Kofleriaceae bacterium]
KPLRRGLDPDPAKRWPSMNALLGAITRRETRPGVALAIGSGALALAGLAVAMFARGDDRPTCEAPFRDPALVWPADRAAKLRAAQQGPTVDAIDADIAAWKQVRERACAAPAGSREPRLACLDGVLARMNLVATAVERVKDAPNLDTGDMLVAPAVCESARPPRLGHAVPDELVDVAVKILERSRSRTHMTKEEAQALIAKSASEPCASAFASMFGLNDMLTTERVAQLDEAERAAQRCGADRVVADSAVAAATWVVRDRLLDAQAPAKVRRAEAAAEKVSQPDLDADLDMMRAELAARADRLDDAITWTEKAAKGYAARHRTRMEITASVTSLGYRELRGRDEDLAATRSRLTALRDRSAAAFGSADRLVREIEGRLAYDEMANGEVASAHAKLEALRDPAPIEKPVKVTGRVVDEHGNPVAGAFVAGSNDAYGDSVSVMVPNDNERRATTAADGTFVLPEVSSDGVIVAQLGELRSSAELIAESVTLTLRPTSRIEGKVELHGQPARSVIVAVRDTRLSITVPYAMYTTLKPDGTFVLDGVPRGKVVVQTALSRGATTRVVTGTELVIDKPVVKNVSLELKSSKRQVHVIVRSQFGVDVPAAQVVVLPGRVATQSALEINERLRSAAVRMGTPILGEQAPKPVLEKAKLRDLYATMTEVPEGEASACALGLPKDMGPEIVKKLQKPENLAKITVTCVPIAPTDDVVVVEVMPWPRFD